MIITINELAFLGLILNNYFRIISISFHSSQFKVIRNICTENPHLRDTNFSRTIWNGFDIFFASHCLIFFNFSEILSQFDLSFDHQNGKTRGTPAPPRLFSRACSLCLPGRVQQWASPSTSSGMANHWCDWESLELLTGLQALDLRG